VRSISRRGWQREERDDLPLSEVWYVVWERRLAVLGTVLVLVALALLFGLFREPVYTAEATVDVQPRENLSSNEETAAFLEEVRSDVTTERGFRRAVMRQAGWEDGSEEFTDRLDAQTFVTQDGRSGLRVRFSGSEPEQAARVANAYAGLFVERVERLNDERLAGGTLAADASVERRATPPAGTSLRLLIYAAVAAGVGLLVGGAAAMLLEGRARSWRDARDAELTLRAPVLGVIPDYSSIEEEG
jgi:capsular polysaccharide biosynthesis protein